MATSRESYAEIARRLAARNAAEGGRPYACVIVEKAGGAVVASAADLVLQTRDPLAHAEILAVRDATAIQIAMKQGVPQTRPSSGQGQIAFVVGHDCPMCSSALSIYGPDEIVQVSISDQQGPVESGHGANKSVQLSAVSSGNGAVSNDKEARLSESISSTMLIDVPTRRPVMQCDGVTVPTWGDQGLNAYLLKMTPEQHKRVVAHRGSPAVNLVKDVKELNMLVRGHYAKFIADIGMHLRPCIIASDYDTVFQGVGGTFTLYNEDGSVEKITPAPASYQILKSLSHVTLGISAIVLPFLDCPEAVGWQDKLSGTAKQIDVVLSNLAGCTELASEVVDHLQEMLAITTEYITTALKMNRVDTAAFQAYTAKVSPYIMKSMANASRIQVEADLPAMMNWKRKLGDKWKDIYVIVPTVWPVDGDSPRERILAFLLPNPAAQIVKIQNQSSEVDLFTTLGRVVGDRSMAALTVGAATPMTRDAQLALSTPRDLNSSSCADAMMNYLLKCDPSELEIITQNLSPEATAAIAQLRGHQNVDLSHPAINSFYVAPMSAQSFGDALRHPFGSATVAATFNGNGCPFGKQ